MQYCVLGHKFFCNTQYGSVVGYRGAISSLDHLLQNPSIPQDIAHLLAKLIKWTLKVIVQKGKKVTHEFSTNA